MKSIYGILAAGVVSAYLVACGGGGGGSNSPCLANGGCGSASSSSTSSGGTAATYSVALSAPSSSLTYPGSVNLTATVSDKSGNPVVGATVEFVASDTSKISIGSGGSVLTDGNGQGLVSVKPLSSSSLGVVQVTATATITTGTGGTATATASFQLNSNTSSSGPGPAAKLKYLGTTVSRLFVRGASAGNTNAVEVTQVQYQVRDANDVVVTGGVNVYFDVTKRNSDGTAGDTTGVLTCVPDVTGTCLNVTSPDPTKQYMVTSDSSGTATITVQSGTSPMSFNVLAAFNPFLPSTYNSSNGRANPVGGTTATEPTWISDQLVVSSNKPDQSKFFLLWQSGATCAKSGTRTYPCAFVVNVFDKIGQPVADGTPVNVVSATGGVVLDTLAGQPSGTCLTKNSQCAGNYTGKSTVPFGSHVIVAYTQGDNATPTGVPITDGGVGVGTGNVVVNCVSPGTDCTADGYIRDVLNDSP